MEDRHSFTGRMLDRATNRRNLNGAVVDTTSEHLRRKHNVLCAIDDNLGHQQSKNCHNVGNTLCNSETMKIEQEGSNVSIITSLTATIDDLDAQINALGIQNTEILNNNDAIPESNQIYPALTNIQLNTVRKNNENEKKNEAHSNDEKRMNIYETPKATRRFHKPNLESTRKSSRLNTNDQISPQIESSLISTIPLIDNPSIHHEKSVNFVENITDIPDEVEKFLQNALGDELYSSTATYINAQDMTNSGINASDVLPRSRTPFHKKIKKILKRHNVSLKNNSTICASKTTESFDRSVKLYRSLSQRVKKKIRVALSKQRPRVERPSPIVVPEFPQGPVDEKRTERIEHLLCQVRVQQTVISQANKALKACYLSKEFIGSPEEVESQRLLLLASLRKRLLMNELKILSSPDHQYVQTNSEKPTTEFAEVQINSIKLTLSRKLQQKPEFGEIHQWFLVVICEGLNIWASQPVPCPIDSFNVEFPDFSCRISKLTPKLKIIVEVYVLDLITGVKYPYDKKYHISKNEELENSTCPSPTKFLKKVERPPVPRIQQSIYLTSSFVPSGYVELLLNDLVLASPWPLSGVPNDSILLGTIDLKLSSKLHMSISHNGFLNYGNESGGYAIWNRWWCVFIGHTLMFWNYPREQESKKPPIKTIDLIDCISEKIAPINRSLCAKPRTLLIETMRPKDPTDRDSLMMECRQTCTVIRHLLSFDSTRELVDWMSKLNYALSVLRGWNINTSDSAIRTISPASPMISDL